MIHSRKLDSQLGTLDQGFLTTEDGVQLLYQTFGEGPAIVFANGIGVRYPGALRQIQALRRHHRIICWDYRGMGQSVMPDPLEGDVSMSRHARDILAILDHLEERRAIFIGWSMGVQVSLEVLRLDPGRVAGLVALFGTYAAPFRTGLPSPLGRIVEGVFGFGLRAPALAQGLLDLAVTLPRIAFHVLVLVRFVGDDADREVFDSNVQDVAGVEKRLYLRTMLALARHDASDVLGRISCPSVIVCGERDYLTPPEVARWMADRIPGAEYHEVKGGTHFALIEQPDLVNGWIRDLASRAYPDRDGAR